LFRSSPSILSSIVHSLYVVSVLVYFKALLKKLFTNVRNFVQL
jgi:hypothetical protein